MRKYITHSNGRFFYAITGTRNEIRDKGLLQITYIYGLRVSELVDLRLEDLDMTEENYFLLGDRKTDYQLRIHCS
ncbi:tyrosine-type recombinase/integrase [Escherichia coli]|uniref:tyrosine-type recombinase/integrase n=1 Tax=Escherichia coli TaxID=562 RepID=UPI0002A3F37D|nr:tyrosine-type recombinase/integrase [Escherichia coli]ELF95393.1 hypothetical protein A1S5_04659 [Escherichia coli KTE48]